MDTRMPVFEVFCLVATAILLWAESFQLVQYNADALVLTECTALQGEQAAQNTEPFSHIRPPPLKGEKPM